MIYINLIINLGLNVNKKINFKLKLSKPIFFNEIRKHLNVIIVEISLYSQNYDEKNEEKYNKFIFFFLATCLPTS